MTRENDCVEDYHIHVGQCMRAGYANGLADAQVAAMREVADMAARETAHGSGLSKAALWAALAEAWDDEPSEAEWDLAGVMASRALEFFDGVTAGQTAARITQLESELAAAKKRAAEDT